jgi:ketosteroid isomerase-like protein
MGPSSEDSGYEAHNLNITADDEIAFCHALNHCYGKAKNGQKMDMWMRSTHCFKKINGKWLITHEQYSVPVDFESGKALMDLRPDKILN